MSAVVGSALADNRNALTAAQQTAFVCEQMRSLQQFPLTILVERAQKFP